MSTSSTLRIPLRVVFYQEEGRCVAHCLEFDLIGDGDTKTEALAELTQAIDCQIDASVKHDNPNNLFSPADGELFRKFAAGSDVAIGELELPRPEVIESMEAREYSDDPDLVATG